jgi:RHS repeat-associated protein
MYLTPNKILLKNRPFGMAENGRKFTQGNSKYRYGFNDKELDNDPVQYDYGFRIYDPRLARFKSLDPLQKKFPELTPYQFASNSPIANIDLDGREALYYTTTITNIYHHQVLDNGSVKTWFEQKITTEGIKMGLFPNGKLGSGTMYTVATQTTDIYECANGDVESVSYTKPIVIVEIYKLSEADEMKLDVSKRPMFKGKYQLIVYGSGSDNSESPGERMNPNSKTESIDMKAFSEMLEPTLTGMGIKSPTAGHEPLSLEEITNSQTEDFIRKAEKAQKKKDEAREPNSTVCSMCKVGPHPQDDIDAYITDKYGNVKDTLRKNAKTGKVDTIPAQQNSIATPIKH